MSACPVCGAEAPVSGRGLNECRGCGLATAPEKRFHPAVYASEFEDDIYRGSKAGLFAGGLDLLGGLLPGRGRLLDIGCASGFFLRLAADQGWRPEGVELAPAMASKAVAAGFRVYTVPVEGAGLEENAYDAVTVFEVFCLMDAPAAAAAEIFRVMKPGGALYVREFNAAFHLPLYALERRGFFRPLGVRPSITHNYNFTARSLRLLLGRAGFRDISITNSRPTAGDPYRTGGRLGGFLTSALKVLYYWLAQALWFLSFGRVYAGSSLIITARK